MPLLAVNFIGTLGFSLVLPFLVYMVTRFGGNEVVYGLLGATYSFFQLFGAPLLGRWSDRHGRRKILFVTQVGTLLSWVIFLVTLSIPVTVLTQVSSGWLGSFTLTLPLLLLFFARALDGSTGGNISVATAYVVDLSSEKDQARNMSRMSLSTNLGFVLGPMIAGLLGATVLGERLPVLAAIAISLIGLAMIVLFLPESRPSALDGPPCGSPTRRVMGKEPRDCYDQQLASTKTGNENRLSDLLKIEKLPVMFGLYFFIFLAFNIYYASFPMHAAKALNWKTEELGFFFSFAGVAMIIVQGPLLSALIKRFSTALLFGVGSVFMVLSFSAYSITHDYAAYLAALLFALGNGIMWPSYMAILAGLGPKDGKGAIQGFAAGIGSLASITGLILGGFAYTRFGTMTFVFAGSIFLVCTALAFYMPVIKPTPESPAAN